MIGDLALFLAAGLLGGAVNVAAGGAKLFVFPLLLSAGLPPVAANATATVALWPAQIPGVVVFRHAIPRTRAAMLIDPAVAGVGALAGALALIGLGEATFVGLVPLFLAVAVTAILFGDRIKGWAARRAEAGAGPWLARGMVFACGIYAGYFGAAVGFMFLASVLLAGAAGIHAANAQKNLLSVAANTAAVVPLMLSGLVVWPAAIAVFAGGLIGGYAGARIIRLIPPRPLKWAIALLGTALTLTYLFGLRG